MGFTEKPVMVNDLGDSFLSSLMMAMRSTTLLCSSSVFFLIFE
jgi:hypothetical protein